ncbi:MAG: ATP-binding cassette domain-containing protein [Gammaproteobacteria bacterium]|nr:ATP-binding cassette domain-containing protein [Gammaproteobacteria bacterium]
MSRSSSNQGGSVRLLQVLRFLKPYRFQVVAALIALVFTAAVMLSIGHGLRLLIDKGMATESGENLTATIAVFFVLSLGLAMGTFARFFLMSWIGERVVTDIREKVFHHVIDLHPGFFETNLSGEIQSRITTDTTLLQTVLGSSISIALRNIIMFFGGVTLMLITNLKLAAIVLVSVPFIVSPILLFGRRVRALSRTSQDRVADVSTFVGEALQNIKTVQAYNHQRLAKEEFSFYAEQAFDTAIKRVRYRSVLIAVAILLILGAIGAMLWVGGQDVLAGVISGGDLAAFVFYAIIVAMSVGAISEVYGELQRAGGATDRLMELLAAESLIVGSPLPVALSQKNYGKVEIRALSFTYPSRQNQPALKNVSLLVPAGTSLAIVGPSGAGKSTLFDLMLRFYDPQQGGIYIDGVNIRDLTLEQLRESIAIVPQLPTLFTGNVWKNIRYGKPDASDEEVIEAANAAYASEFIARLPDGYDSDLGEGGVRLSGGQRQRIAIARAILKNPRILLLDEATSALDAESEQMVQKALEKLMAGRTTFIIAHRLATVVHTDSIAVFNHGELVELGSHRELMKSSELYSRLAKLQFKDSVSS